MSPSILTQVYWFFFSCSSRRRKSPSSPELPTVAPAPHYETDSLRSWQNDKQQFLRRPSLRRASTHESQKQIPLTPPRGPEIYVEDWSSRGLNMANFFETPSSRSVAAAVESGVSTNNSSALATVPEAESESLANGNTLSSPAPAPPNTSSEHFGNDNGASSLESSMSQPSTSSSPRSLAQSSSLGSPASQSSDVQQMHPTRKTKTRTKPKSSRDDTVVALVPSFSPYTSTPHSAVSGLLWDPPSFSVSHSTPLPGAAPGFLSTPHFQSTVALVGESSTVAPYPDLFDFNMYMRRISRDSLCDAIELGSRSSSLSKTRLPLANLDSGRNAVDFSHVLAEKSDEGIITAPLLTQDEFLKMFVFTESV